MIGKNFFLVERYPFLNKVVLTSRIAWSINLRWIAVITFFVTLVLLENVFELLLPYNDIFEILVLLALFNLVYFIISRWIKNFTFRAEFTFLTIQIFIDLIILTALLNLTGGIRNPLYLFYLFHIILSSIILHKNSPYIIASFVVLLFGSLIYLENAGFGHHEGFFRTESQSDQFYTVLVMLIFSFSIFVCTYITTTFMKIFRSSNQELERVNKKLVQADKIKSDFFKFTSHELKSPIVAVKSAIDGVIKIESNNMRSAPLEILNRASSRVTQMLNILNELLALSKNKKLIDGHSLREINLNHILNECISNEIIRIKEKELEIKTNFVETDVTIKGNEDDFKILAANLISNAVNYSPNKGCIKITTKVINGGVGFEVEDNGIGIPQEDLKKIFSEFYRSENAKKYVNFGTGLGLCIVKQIVDNYNGKIDIQSKLNKGTTFSVYIPPFNKYKINEEPN